ncbi:MAG: three component ABC system middle component [Longicatena sp.]
MNKSAYYLYNNVAITAGAIVAMLKSTERLDLAKIALFLPLLLDDNIVKKINEKSEYSFDNIVSLNVLNMSNFNERYRDILPLLMDALSILLDMEVIVLRGAFVINKKSEVCTSMLECGSIRLQSISSAASKLMNVTQYMDLSKMYYRLNIEL